MGSLPAADAEDLRTRAVALGAGGRSSDARELEALLKNPAPAVRRAAASALGKLIDRAPDLRALLIVSLAARDARLRHWCMRCRRVVTEEEARRSQAHYGKTYCFHCFEEKMHEDATFETDVEAAKRLRTVDEVAVQSKGEKRIGDWLAVKGIAYRYDARMLIAGGERIRPDFYLPEFDLYIEYWGMDTPEYLASRQRKQVLYQRERKKLISLSFRDLERLEEVLEEKLARHIQRL